MALFMTLHDSLYLFKGFFGLGSYTGISIGLLIIYL